MGKHLTLLLALAAALVLAGCGSKETTAPELQVVLAPDSTGIDLCGSLDISADIQHSDDTRLDWYVNGVLGGNATLGYVTQTNPATYNAPRIAPDPAKVVVKAISKADTSKQARCVISLKPTAVTTFYVSAVMGSDTNGTGCLGKPFKSIAHALQLAHAGMTIQVAPGIYDAANGETFPITLGDSISLVGENWETTVIRGHADTLSSYFSTVVFAGAQSALRKFTLELGPTVQHQCEVVIFIGEVAGARVDSVRTSERGRDSVVRVSTSSDAVIENCRFEAVGGDLASRGFEIVFNDVGTIIKDCTVSGYYTGIFFNGSSNALVENCVVQDNATGIELCCLHTDSSNPVPDLGGGARGSLGGNVISDNLSFGLQNSTRSTIYAKHNVWNNDPPQVGNMAGSDIFNESTGSVIWE